MTGTEVKDLPHVTTHNGTAHVGGIYHDKRLNNRRWLRVDRIEESRYGVDVHYTVIHQDYGDGRVTQPMRTGTMKVDRLLSSVFIRTTAPGVAG